MPRPKSKKDNTRLSLTIPEESIKKGREVADLQNKSLSEFTGNIYDETYNQMQGLQEDPLEEVRRLKDVLENVEKKFKEKEGGTNEDKK